MIGKMVRTLFVSFNITYRTLYSENLSHDFVIDAPSPLTPLN
jgi:hypothetical protein